MHKVKTGAWRDDAEGPMQVVSGPIGRQRVHYQAPPAQQLDAEMQAFLDWFNRRCEPEGLLRAGLAHLWFVTIHPFEDGNGRVARAIADQALAQSENSGQRFYSMSSQIRKERSDYYDMLERSQKGALDVTDWLALVPRMFFARARRCRCGLRQCSCARPTSGNATPVSPSTKRQKTVLNRLLDGFEGKLTAKKWAAIGKCSIPTAQRDINELVERGILRRNPGGSKNTSYDLVMGA